MRLRSATALLTTLNAWDEVCVAGRVIFGARWLACAAAGVRVRRTSRRLRVSGAL